MSAQSDARNLRWIADDVEPTMRMTAEWLRSLADRLGGYERLQSASTPEVSGH